MTFLAASLLPLALAFPQVSAASTIPAVEPIPILQRIVVLGASVSDGYGLDANVGAKTGLTDIVDSTILVPHGPVQAMASLLFFTSPTSIGEKLVAKAKASDPTLVLAIDYLFWFGYGLLPSDEARLALLEKGLASLEVLTCPLMIADLPDMSEASRPAPPGGFPPLLVPEQVPSKEALAKLNSRIREWAAARENTVVVPLADLLARFQAGSEVEIHGNRWVSDARNPLIGKDRLHPTLEGAVALWLAGLDALAASRDDLPPDAFDWSAKSVVTRVFESKAKEREKNNERELERLQKAEKKKKESGAGGG
jgi:hypothetical protein